MSNNMVEKIPYIGRTMKHSLNRELEVFERYFRPEESLVFQHLGDGESIDWLANMLLQGKVTSSECPDIIVTSTDSVLGIEHFEIDNAEQSRRGGSPFRLNEAEVLNRMLIELNSNGATPVLSSSYEIPAKLSYISYMHNLIQVFESHRKRLPIYRETPSTVYQKQNIAFLIEDVSPLGQLIETEDGCSYMNLMLNGQYLEYLRKCSQQSEGLPEFILIVNDYSPSTIQVINTGALDEYIYHAIDYERSKFISTKPKVINILVDQKVISNGE